MLKLTITSTKDYRKKFPILRNYNHLYGYIFDADPKEYPTVYSLIPAPGDLPLLSFNFTDILPVKNIKRKCPLDKKGEEKFQVLNNKLFFMNYEGEYSIWSHGKYIKSCEDIFEVIDFFNHLEKNP